jgi:hypothetical protein
MRTSAVAASGTFFVRARNLCAAGLLCMQRRNWETSSRYKGRASGFFMEAGARPCLNQVSAIR